MAFRSAPFLGFCGAAILLVASPVSPICAHAEGASEPPDDPPWRLIWIGAQTVGKNWSVYTGTTYALTGPIDREGLRLRIVSGYGRYGYHSGADRFKGQHAFGDALIGYQLQFADLTVKGFAGIATAGHSVTPFDPDNTAIGFNYGAAAALEGWLNLSDRMWLSASGKYTTVFDSFGAEMRFGYRWWRQISAGLEAGVSGNTDYVGGRAALFVHHRWDRADVRLSLGAAADREMDVAPYAALNLSLKY